MKEILFRGGTEPRLCTDMLKSEVLNLHMAMYDARYILQNGETKCFTFYGPTYETWRFENQVYIKAVATGEVRWIAKDGFRDLLEPTSAMTRRIAIALVEMDPIAKANYIRVKTKGAAQKTAHVAA